MADSNGRRALLKGAVAAAAVAGSLDPFNTLAARAGRSGSGCKKGGKVPSNPGGGEEESESPEARSGRSRPAPLAASAASRRAFMTGAARAPRASR
ncbi:hypothetical protein LG943_12220 [Streptomonospora sp. S1-112]|uniref:Uncharacterized protein n=1 Tax=Streptomonospora mangrovi TaxID=2883123 RepID=A0A9X3SHB5_9ACTN|nr:hypothetical protein [Streptomonospora mangrovi]MDA0565079.1 hypothetical protein [Streptomonospora mangrovi]